MSIFSLGMLAVMIYLLILIIQALRKYIRSGEVRKEKKTVCRSLGEAIQYHRTRCKMTQEFVAELFEISAEELLSGRQEDKNI